MENDVYLYPDVGAFPLWDDEAELDIHTVPLSPGLKRRLIAWNQAWVEHFYSEENGYTAPGYDGWTAEGMRLAQEVSSELGPRVKVSFIP